MDVAGNSPKLMRETSLWTYTFRFDTREQGYIISEAVHTETHNEASARFPDEW